MPLPTGALDQTLLSVAFPVVLVFEVGKARILGRLVSGYAFRHTVRPAVPWQYRERAALERRVKGKKMRALAPPVSPPQPRLAQQPPGLPIFLKPLLPILPAPKRIKIDSQPPSQRPHRNQIPDPPPSHPLALDHHRQKVNLLRGVRHMLPRSPP